MIQYALNEIEILEILSAFASIELEPTSDKDKIKSAWKKKVSNFHPDKAKTENEKSTYHTRFIEIGKARDVCLEATEISDLLIQLKTIKTEFIPEKIPERFFSKDELEEEWKEFVKDENSYFNLLDSSILSLRALAKLILYSIFFFIGFSIFFGIIIAGLLNLFTNHVDISIVGWMLGITILIIIYFQIQEYFIVLGKETLTTLSKTGFPLKFFFILWFLGNLISVLSIIYDKDLGLFLFLAVNLLFFLLYNNLFESLSKIEEELKRIREKFDSDQISLKAKNRFKV
ncbi:MAG: J domain-containing protein [Leptospiraceae bacterium]|nr:J domain-containing protein [Leptospiraceae bacterium]